MNEVRTEEETSLVVTEPVLVEEMQRPSRRADGGYDSADDDDAENDAEEGKLLETIGESAVCFVTTGRHSPTTLLFQRLFLQLLHRGGRFSHRNRANHARRRADGFLEQGGTRVLFPHAKHQNNDFGNLNFKPLRTPPNQLCLVTSTIIKLHLLHREVH